MVVISKGCRVVCLFDDSVTMSQNNLRVYRTFQRDPECKRVVYVLVDAFARVFSMPPAMRTVSGPQVIT